MFPQNCETVWNPVSQPSFRRLRAIFKLSRSLKRRFYKFNHYIQTLTCLWHWCLVELMLSQSKSSINSNTYRCMPIFFIHTCSGPHHPCTTDTPLAPYSTVHVAHNHSPHSQSPSLPGSVPLCWHTLLSLLHAEFTHTILTSCLYLSNSSTEPGWTEHSSRILSTQKPCRFNQVFPVCNSDKNLAVIIVYGFPVLQTRVCFV